MEIKSAELFKDFYDRWMELHPGFRLHVELQDTIRQYLLMAYVVGVDHTVEEIEKKLTKISNYPVYGNISTKKMRLIIHNL